jgi:uncharacterized protein
MSSNAAPLPQAKAGNEPSMEEILASIRRIIADDSVGTKRDEAYVAPPPPAPPVQVAPTPVEVAPAPPPVIDEPDADVLDLAEVATVASDIDDLQMVGLKEDDLEDELEGTPVSIDPTPIAAPVLVAPLAPLPPVENVNAMSEHILRKETGGLVANAFAQLSRQSAMPAPGRTIEDMMVEILRPMLADWMDSHLPSIVERLVKAEIERVSRGG